MKRLILAVLMTVAFNVNADMSIDNIPEDKVYPVYFVDENGYYQKWERPKKYEDWTYTDENGYDYTIIIKVK